MLDVQLDERVVVLLTQAGDLLEVVGGEQLDDARAVSVEFGEEARDVGGEALDHLFVDLVEALVFALDGHAIDDVAVFAIGGIWCVRVLVGKEALVEAGAAELAQPIVVVVVVVTVVVVEREAARVRQYVDHKLVRVDLDHAVQVGRGHEHQQDEQVEDLEYAASSPR